MNLTWHIVKKDLRALKWPLLLWTLLIVAKLGVGFIALRSGGADTEQVNSLMHLQVFSFLLAALEGISFVLAAALIHEDLLVGTTAFWVTRPISGARLLRAKLLSLVLIFGLLPLLVTLPWWLWNGYGSQEILWAALETLLIHAACVLVGLLWAVVTDGFARFLLWTLVMLVAFPSVAATVGLYLAGQNPHPSPGVMLTRICVELGLAVAGILALVVHQFLTRKTWRSVGLIGAMLGLIIATALWWPWNLDPGERWNRYVMQRAVQNTRQVAEPAGFSYALESVQMTPPSANHPERLSKVLVRFTVEGLPANEALWPWTGNYNLRWPDGTSVSGFTALSWNPRQKLATRVLLGDSAKGEDEVAHFSATLYLSPDQASRLQHEPPVFTLDTRLWIMRSGTFTKVPAQPGVRVKDGAATERIAEVETEGNSLVVTTVRTYPAFWSNALGSYVEGVRSTFAQSIMVNRERAEVSWGHREWNLQIRIASVTIDIDKSVYTAPAPIPAAKASRADSLRQADWIQHAELMRENYSRQGWFAHKLEVAALRLDEPKP